MNEILNLIGSFLTSAVCQAAPLTIAGIGVAYAEKAGILNIGEEGIMLAGAFTGFITAFFSGSLLLGVLGGMAGGLIISMLHAFMCIHCKTNQTISGLALNYLTLGLTSFLFLLAFGKGSSLPSIAKLKSLPVPLLSKIPMIGEALFNQNILVYLVYLIVIVSCIILYKTEWGISITAVGENPGAADTAGINVYGVRYLMCAVNGLWAASAAALSRWDSWATFGGYHRRQGYIALVAVILGRRNPVGILLTAMIIGFTESLQFTLQAKGIPLPSQAFSMLPYVVAVIVLLLSFGKGYDPSALGVPYDRNKR